jgi:hypothetical protein
MRQQAWGALLALSITVSGCAMGPMPELQPTMANLQILRTKNVPALAVGEFRLAKELPPSMDRSIAIRAMTIKAPGTGSFAGYLKQTLETELWGAGKLNPTAVSTIEGELTQSRITTGLPEGRAVLAARFRVRRAGQTIYDRELTVSTSWATNFIGAIAIPEAMDRYTSLYPALVGELLGDAAFQTAVQAP